MKAEEIWKRFQQHMGYTDEEMKIFRSDPMRVRMVTETPEFVKCRVIAEVIESHGCHARHKAGDRFVMTAGGQLITEACPKRMCMFALGPVSHQLPAIYERLISKSDPEFKNFNIVQCTDVGLAKGGWGKILMNVYVEKPK
ncbi:MAG: hypothetical protein MUP41_01365 [Desulfobacterales bacterium]|nr:hypothetical protein [Desulfobacterales bacterium]